MLHQITDTGYVTIIVSLNLVVVWHVVDMHVYIMTAIGPGPAAVASTAADYRP